ncbi:MAG: lytic transglycosylase domain-containing protein [Aliihoeflea sp.]
MTKLTLAAAAFAAGMISFANFSHADTDLHAMKAHAGLSQNDQTAENGLPGVDPQTTGSIAASEAGKAKAEAITDAKFASIVAKYAAETGVPPALAHAVIRVESNYRPNVTGRAGEVGLMQIKPATARMMGYSGSAKGLYDPETNIRFGMKYLAKAQSVGDGTTCGTILKYNAGHGAKRMNPISANYCAKVQRIMAGA